MQHPLTNYVKAVAQREQSLRKSLGLSQQQLEDSRYDNPDHIWDEQCILKAQEVLTDLSYLKMQLQGDGTRKLDDLKRVFQHEKDQRVHSFKQSVTSHLADREVHLLAHCAQQVATLNGELKAQHDKQVAQLKRKLDRQIAQEKTLMASQRQEGGNQEVEAEAEFEDQMIQYYEREKERYQKKAKELKREAKEMLQSGEIQ